MVPHRPHAAPAPWHATCPMRRPCRRRSATGSDLELGYGAFVDRQTIDSADAALKANDVHAARDVADAAPLFGQEGTESDRGCNAIALAATQPSGTGSDWEIYRSLLPGVESALRRQHSTDPQPVDAVDEWRDCLLSAGGTPTDDSVPRPDRASLRGIDNVSADGVSVATADLGLPQIFDGARPVRQGLRRSREAVHR